MKDPLLHQQAERLEVGRKGEAWVTAMERQKLEGTPYAGTVEVSSPAQRISFDIKSRTLSGAPLYIEVKSTEGEVSLPFYMSAEEYTFAEHCLDQGIPYELHRVHHVFNDELRGEIVYTAQDIVELFDKTPANYILKHTPAHPETDAEGCWYLPWEDCAERIPGTHCRFYLAKIEGPIPNTALSVDSSTESTSTRQTRSGSAATSKAPVSTRSA